MNDLSKIQSLREKMIIAMVPNALAPILNKSHTNTHIAEQISRFVDSFISQHEPDALIPVHVANPLSRNILTKITRNGKITRTIPVVAEDFYSSNYNSKEKIVNSSLIKSGNGELKNISYRTVGFKNTNNISIIFIEVTGDYIPVNNSNEVYDEESSDVMSEDLQIS
jgi:hypothetical protein